MSALPPGYELVGDPARIDPVAAHADVYVLEDHRGQGLARAMVGWLQQHAELQGLRRWLLMTVDAHSLYQSLGWTPLAHPERGMERYAGVVY